MCHVHVLHVLSEGEARVVCAVLWSQHIPVSAVLDAASTVHVTGGRVVSTAEEITVLRAFKAVTDGRVDFHACAVAA